MPVEFWFIVLLAIVVYGLMYLFQHEAEEGKKERVRSLVYSERFHPYTEITGNRDRNRYGYYNYDYPGCYLILIFDQEPNGNYSNYIHSYAGQSIHVMNRLNQHFTGKGKSEIYQDICKGRRVFFQIIRCDETQLNEVEINLINAYKGNRSYNIAEGGAKHQPSSGKVGLDECRYTNRSLKNKPPANTAYNGGYYSGRSQTNVSHYNENISNSRLENRPSVNHLDKSVDDAKKKEIAPMSRYDTLQRNAANGNAKSMMELASMYERGDEVEKDMNKAFLWYKQAANLGNQHAGYKLALFYLEGVGTDKDADKAKSVLKDLSKSGYVPATKKLEDLNQ